jgi:uncharacterized protein (UPF0332 family)
MPTFASSKHLLRVGKGKKNDIERWKEGRYIEGATGRSLEELLNRAAADRLHLARSFLRDAKRLLGASPPLCRFAVSRCYYSMYHAMRAAVFISHGGDDFEEHRTLPGKVPDDLIDREVWANALKDARERRNSADYDPYPKSDASWHRIALQLTPLASQFLQHVSHYLKGKGCTYI